MNINSILKPVTSEFKQNLENLLSALDFESFTPDHFRTLLSDIKKVLDNTGCKLLLETLSQMQQHPREIDQDGNLYRFKMTSVKQWLSPFGVLDVPRHLYQPDRGGQSIVPLDEQCGMQDKYQMPPIEELSAFASAFLVPAEVEVLMKKLLPTAPSATAIKRTLNDVGSFVSTSRQSVEAAIERKKPLSDAGDTLAISWDGTTVPIREKGIKRGRKAHRPGVRDGDKSPTSWKEGGVGTLSIYRSGNANQSHERLDTRYLAYMPQSGMKDLIANQVDFVKRTCCSHQFKSKVILCDGKREIWKIAEKEPVYRGFTMILDFYHATEYLSKASEVLFGKKSQKAKQWYKKQRCILKEKTQGVQSVLRSIDYRVKRYPLKKSRKKEIQKVITYLKNNQERMQYAEYQKRGLPIGSGVVEAGCKTIFGGRLKRSGMRWSYKGGQNVLNLRTFVLDKRWDIMWQEYQNLKNSA